MNLRLLPALRDGFIDEFGMVGPRRNAGSTNDVMFTGEAVVIADRIGELNDEWKKFWNDAMEGVEIGSGLIKRTPTDPEEEAPDDYYGFLAGAKRCNPGAARKFLLHGLLHLGFYNTDGEFAWSDCLWRQPQMITHALWAAGFWAGPFRIFFIGSLLYAIYQDKPALDVDARRIGWLLIQNWDGKGWISKWAVNKWKTWLFKVYPDGMKGVAKRYYSGDHPFQTYIPTF